MRCCAALALLTAVLAIAGRESDLPRLVGEGTISTPGDESAFTITPDGKTAFFSKTSPATTGDPMRLICMARLDADGHWLAPEIAAFSGEYHDAGPALTPDGSRLYFVSDRALADPAKHDFNIWYVDRVGSGWSKPTALAAPVNSDAQEYGISVAANGTLYFASDRKGGEGSFDLYRARLVRGEYPAVDHLGKEINTVGPEVQPAISPDETTLVFTAGRREDEIIGIHKEYAHGDLYVSFQDQGRWWPARNCGGSVNSGAAESWPSFSSDGKLLFFTSERGFATNRPTHRMSWLEIRSGLTSTLNGMGNIYQVNASALRTTTEGQPSPPGR